MKVVVVYSGGLDSTVLLVQAVKEYEKVVALNFDYGSKHNVRERAAAMSVCNLLEVPIELIELDFIGKLFKSDLLKSGGNIPEGHYESDMMKSTVVPFRNGIMLSIAAGYAENIDARKILIASHAGDHAVYPDCRPDFNNGMDIAIRKGTINVGLYSPFQHIHKTDIVRKGVELNAPMHLTYSCYNGRAKHCGKCCTCVERVEAFQQANIIDPIKYEVEIDWSNCSPYQYTDWLLK